MIPNENVTAMRSPRAIMVLFVLLAALVSGCAGGGPIAASTEASQEVSPKPYHLGNGDKLHVTVFGEDNLSGDYIITPAGNIAFPLTGNIRAVGLTVAELQRSITSALAKDLVQDPHVVVDANGLRPFFILGEVNKPGQYSYLPDLTVLNAVATAQGFTYRADSSYVYVRHAGQPSEQEYPLTAAMIVAPGDTIRVTQRYF